MGKDRHQPTEADVKVATVDLEAVDNMATLPVGQHRQQGSDIAIAEKHNTTNKEMELKYVQPKPSKKYVNMFNRKPIGEVGRESTYLGRATPLVTHSMCLGFRYLGQ